jgi:hypothetical protein
MPRIRLRDCYVRFLDGYRGTAKVAVTGSNGQTTLQVNELESDHGPWPLGTRLLIANVNQIYTVGAVTLGPATGRVKDATISIGDDNLDVDQITGRVPVGTTFAMAGVTGTFTVTATTETTGDTTNIAFTPVLEEDNLPADEAAITFSQIPGSITISPPLATADGLPQAAAVITILGRCLNVKIGDGNLTWDEVTNFEYEMDRGHIDAVVEGDDEPLSVTLDSVYEFVTALTGSNVPTPEDVLKRRGEAADWITTGADPCELYAVDIELDFHPPCDVPHEITTFKEFRWDTVNHELGDATLRFEGRCKNTEPETIRRAY